MSPEISVIIPTYNRKSSVLRLLNSLCNQSLPVTAYEVIVVDDGSRDDTATIAQEAFPFAFTYLLQKNSGATIARNYGVSKSQGNVLVFIDDDITISHKTLESLTTHCLQTPNIVVMGTLIQRNDGDDSIYADIQLAEYAHHVTDKDRFVDFVECNTELLCVRRDDFFALDMLQDPTDGRGWPNWDDVDFGYRSHQNGFRLLQAADAIGEHWDYSMGDWQTACHRWQRACKSAVLLFRVHPELPPHLPMLYDKTPINLSQDSLQLVSKKILRQATSSKPIVWMLEQNVKLLERKKPSPTLLRPLYRWIAGSYMYRGYQEGLRAYATNGVGGN
ncbi:MAG: glycosyltransferase family 2 protein [Chloroflexi bacterium]|nr:glycosyltransferase family 2 protein [Chloroflexota bacterium]